MCQIEFMKIIIITSQGLEISQNNLAWTLDAGLGYDGSDRVRLAVRGFENAAQQGNIEAQLKLGDMYYGMTIGLEKDLQKAAMHYKLAADMNHPQVSRKMIERKRRKKC